MLRHVLSDFNLEKSEVIEIINLSEKIKKRPEEYSESLRKRTLIMLFELPSLRTRVSFEAGMTQLGGHAIFYGVKESSFSRAETLEDGVKVLSRYSDCIMARILKQEAMELIGTAATVPVINGMTESYHPCQNLADLLTIREKKGKLTGLKIAYVGDGGCNTANSTMIGCTSVGMEVTVICPDNPRYRPNKKILTEAEKRSGKNINVSHNPAEGVAGADIIYTDVWVSEGMNKEKAERMEMFPPYQVNKKLVSHAEPNRIVMQPNTKVDLTKHPIVMHCLPAHRGLEITSKVLDSPYSVVLDQAENRMWAQMGLLLWLIGEQ